MHGGHWSQFDAWRRSLCKKAQLSLQILVRADREADKMTLWQRSHKEASSHARGRDGGKDKQMLSSPRGGGGSALHELSWTETGCVTRWRWYTGLYECDYTCSCASASVRGQCTVYGSHPSARKRVLEGGWEWGAPTKGIWQGEPKTTKVTLPLVMYSTYSHCLQKCTVCVCVCVDL